MARSVKIYSVCLQPKVEAKLKFLADELCCSKSTLISVLVTKEYNKVKQELYRDKLADKELMVETFISDNEITEK